MKHPSAVLVLVACVGCQSAAGPVNEPALQPTAVPEAILLGAHVAPDPQGVLTAWLDLTNPSRNDVPVQHGACAFAVQLRREGSDAARWHNVPPGDQVCIMILHQVNVGAGATVPVAAGRLVARPGVPAPPHGPFVVYVLLNAGGETRRLRAGTVNLP